MIWFACKKCGKAIGRPDSSAGALIFCDCGHASRIPWESSIAPPRPEPATAKLADPIPFDAPLPPPPPRVERRTRHTPIDANVCFNHTSVDKSAVCSACGLSFCDRCLTSFEQQTLCGPCKNYRTRLLQRRPEPSKLALASFLLALAAGPMLLILIGLTRSPGTGPFLLLALLPPAMALAAGALALRWIHRGKNRAGEHLAVSGISLGAVVAFLAMLIVMFGEKLWTTS